MGRLAQLEHRRCHRWRRTVVLDVDPRSGGDKVLERLEAEHGKLPDTERVATGGGGLHYVFKAPEGTRSRDLEPASS